MHSLESSVIQADSEVPVGVVEWEFGDVPGLSTNMIPSWIGRGNGGIRAAVKSLAAVAFGECYS